MGNCLCSGSTHSEIPTMGNCLCSGSTHNEITTMGNCLYKDRRRSSSQSCTSLCNAYIDVLADKSDDKGDYNNDGDALTDAVKRRDWSKIGEILQRGHTHILQSGHTHILQSGRTHISQSGAGHTQILHSGAGHTQILPSGAGHTQILQSGAGHTQILQSGAGHTQILQSGAGHTQILQSGAGHTHILQSGAGHTQILQSGAGHTQISQSGADHTQILQSGAGHTQILQSGAGHTQMLQSGAGHTQILQSGAGHTQTLQSGAGHTQLLQRGSGQTQIVQSRAGNTQRMWAITQACRLAGEEAVLQHIIPHLHTEGELEAVFSSITWNWDISRLVGKLFQRGLDLSLFLWVVGALDRVYVYCTDELLEQCLVPVFSADQLLSMFTLSVRERQWRTVSCFLRNGMGDAQRRWAVEEALQHVTPENENTSGVIAYCSDDQLGVVFEDAVRRHLWRTVRKLLDRPVDDDLVRQAIEESCRSVCGEPLTDYTLPACRDDQRRDFDLTDAVRRGQWNDVGQLLERGVDDALRRWAVTEGSGRADDVDLLDCIVPYCGDDQLGVVFEEAVRRHLWVTVRKLLDRPVDDDLVRQAIEDSCRSVSGEPLTDYTLPACRDDQRRDFEFTCAFRRGEWKDVGTLLECGVHATLARWAIEESYRSVCGKPLTDYTLPVNYDGQRRDFDLTRAVMCREWKDVGQLLQLGVHATLGRWAIQESYRSVCGKPLTDYTLPAYRYDQRREFNLTRAVMRREWKDVGQLIERGVHATLGRWAIEESYRSVCGEPLTDYTLPACRDDQRRDFELTHAVRQGQWEDVGQLLQLGVHATLGRWAIQESYRNVCGKPLTDYTLPACRDEQCRDFDLTLAVGLGEWNDVGQLLQLGVHATLGRWAIEESYINVSGEPLKDYTLLACRYDQSRDLELTDAVIRGWWHQVGRLLKLGVHDSLRRWAVTEGRDHADEYDLVKYILPHCDDDQLESLLTQAVTQKQWYVVGVLLQRGTLMASAYWLHRMAVMEACKQADEEDIIQHILPHTDHDPLDVPDAGEGADGSWREQHKLPWLTLDQLQLMLDETVRKGLWEVSRQRPQTERHAGRDCLHTAVHLHRHGLEQFLLRLVKHRSNELLFCVLAVSTERELTRVITAIRDRIDRRQTLSDIVCGSVAAMTPFPVDNTVFSKLINFSEDCHLHKLAIVYLDVLHFVVCPELDRARKHSTKNLQTVVSGWQQQLAELYVNTKYSTDTEQALVYLFFCLCRSLDLTEESSDLLCVVLSTIPLLPSLQSAAVRLMLHAKKWDVINNAVLCRVWEDVRRSVLRAAVEQREWTTVRHMADHSLYDDERNWALMQAYYQDRWDVVLALADFGHNADQRKRIYRQVAKHGDGETILELFKRGADVRTVREQLETASPSRERPLRQETVARYQNRLSWLAWLEWKIEDTADNLQGAIQRNKWRAVLHRVRCEPSTLSLALDAAIEKEAWHVVVQLARLGMDAAHRDSLFPEVMRRRQWAVGRALLEGGYFDGGEHGVSVELRRAALPQLLNVGQWTLVARVMEHGVDDEERRQVMWEALDRREGSVVAHIISIMEGRVCVEERERVFQHAIRQGVWQALKRLVEEKDSAGITHRDLTLPAAAKHHQWDILTHCLQHGADVDKRDAAGDTMLHRAAREGDWEGVQGLLLHGVANQHLLDSQGYSVLHTAVKDGWEANWTAVRMLVEFQCDVNQPDPRGVTPLQQMIEHNQGEIIKSAMFWGRNVGQIVTGKGKTALHALCQAGVLDNMHIAVARGGDPLAVTRLGDTVLSLAVENKEGPQELLAECIQLGISTHQPRITDQRMERAGKRLHWYSPDFYDAFCSPTYHAIRHCNKVITEMLYESGSCSNRELHNIAHRWFDHDNYNDEQSAADSYYKYAPPPSIPDDQAAYVSAIVNTPRRLESMCRLVISHNIGVCKPRRRRERVMALRLPTWFSHLHDYILFTDLTGPGSGRVRPRRSARTNNPASRYTFHLATIQDKMAVYFSLSVHNYCDRWQLSHCQQL